MRKDLFKGMLIALVMYAASLTLIYFGSIKGIGIQKYFSDKAALKSLVPMLTVATVPNVLLFMYFVKKNWLYQARGIVTVILMVIVAMAYIKFVD